MKSSSIAICLSLAILLFLPCKGQSTDMRAVNIEAREKKAALLIEARKQEAEARKEAQTTRSRIVADKQKLQTAIEQLKKRNRQLENANQFLEKQIQTLSRQEIKLSEEYEKMSADVSELLGFIRTRAKDLKTLIDQSPQSAVVPDRDLTLQSIIGETKFPDMADVRRMADILFNEIEWSGEVRIQKGPIVDRSGKDTTADILLLGNFTAAYHLPEETGFLLYSDTSRRFFALSREPDYRDRKSLQEYMSGESDAVPVDISRGGALRQLTHRTRLRERIAGGGPIVWPILGIGILAAVIILERFFCLFRKRTDADSLMHEITTLAADQQWPQCESLCRFNDRKPVSRILAAGIEFREACREDMENVLQEAILREIPNLEKFLSTLGMLAAIAPLLGLLGTVTGMINTFHVITYFGTSDPRLMSGGISEALVTTMLGLTVAIPIMLFHTILSRMVDNLVSQMEEKAVAFTNLIYKSRNDE